MVLVVAVGGVAVGGVAVGGVAVGGVAVGGVAGSGVGATWSGDADAADTAVWERRAVVVLLAVPAQMLGVVPSTMLMVIILRCRRGCRVAPSRASVLAVGVLRDPATPSMVAAERLGIFEISGRPGGDIARSVIGHVRARLSPPPSTARRVVGGQRRLTRAQRGSPQPDTTPSVE